MWVTSLGLAGEAGIFASRPFYPMFSGVPNGPLRLSPPQVHAAVHNSGNMVRAEGITEMVGDISVRCRVGDSFFALEEKVTLTVTLNTNITNRVTVDDDAREVGIADVDDSVDLTMLGSDDMETRMGGSILVQSTNTGPSGNNGLPIADMAFEAVTLSVDSSTLTWKLTSADINMGTTTEGLGFDLLISGIRANASALGNDQEITAEIVFAGTSPSNASGPITVADVMTGLDISVEVATGVQCEDVKNATATVTIKEGFDSAITKNSRFLVTFRGIPEGVKVTVPTGVPSTDMVEDDDMKTFGVELRSGLASGADSKGVVERTLAGAGEVVYEVVDACNAEGENCMDSTSAMVKGEWVTLDVTFEWESADVMPVEAMGTVNVSFYPVSTVMGDTLVDGLELASKMPRFVASNNPQNVLEIGLCTTTLLFPFVTNQLLFDTGLVITNASKEDGNCTIGYGGANAPADLMAQGVAGGAQWIKSLAGIASGFQGYITATCGFRDGYGFAYVSNGYPAGPSTVAHGYLAVCTAGDHCVVAND